MTTSPKRYSIDTIIDRARQLDIVLSLRGGKLVTQSHNPIPDKAMAVFRENKAALVDYLTEQERAYQLREQQAIADYELTLQNEPELCAICLGDIDSPESIETCATQEHDGVMYCDAHYPAINTPEPEGEGQRREQFMDAVKRIASEVFPEGCEVHIDPPGYTLADRVKELQAEQQLANKLTFWEKIEAQNARFDPKTPVNWRQYGFKRVDGKWHYPRKGEQAIDGLLVPERKTVL